MTKIHLEVPEEDYNLVEGVASHERMSIMAFYRRAGRLDALQRKKDLINLYAQHTTHKVAQYVESETSKVREEIASTKDHFKPRAVPSYIKYGVINGKFTAYIELPGGMVDVWTQADELRAFTTTGGWPEDAAKEKIKSIHERKSL